MIVFTSSHRKNGPPIIAVTMPTGSSSGASTVRATRSHSMRNAAPNKRRGRQHDAVVGAHHQPHQVRHDDADEADRAAERHRRAGGQRRAEERQPLRPHDVHAAGGGRVVADAQQVERARQHRERGERDEDERQRRDDRAVARHVEVAHQPADGAERFGEVGQVLHEQDQRREERVQRDAGEQQHVGREPAALRRGQPVDDAGGDERAGEAGERDRRDPEHAQLEPHRRWRASRRAPRRPRRRA